MSAVLRQVRAAHRRLAANIWFEQLSHGLLVAGLLWGALTLIDRALFVQIPPALNVSAAVGGLLLTLAAGLARNRIGRLDAALAIDRAAGLKERISTALACAHDADPFVRAAVRDAEQAAARVNVPELIRFRTPQALPWSAAVVVSAALVYVLMPELNLLAARSKDDSAQAAEAASLRRELNVALEEQVGRLQQRLEQHPTLAGLADQLKQLEIPDQPAATPEDIRREAVKRIDHVTERLRQKLDEGRMTGLEAFKKQLAGLQTHQGDDPASKLGAELSRGDLSAARQALEELKKRLGELAQHARPEDGRQLEELSRKLETLASQLAEISEDRKLIRELEKRAGLTEQQARELLEKLAQMDPKQLESALAQRLQNSGMSPEQIQEQARKVAQNLQARQAARQMAQALAKAAQACRQCAGAGQSATGADQATAALGAAQAQLSDLEMADQMMLELQATLEELDELKVSACQGRESRDQTGLQGAGKGLGFGAGVGREPVAHRYRPTQIKGSTQGGQIIGRMLIDAPMIRGQAQAEVYDAVSAAVRDATDAIEREEVPRQYERVLRLYFERLAGLIGESAGQAAAGGQSQGEPADSPKADAPAP